MSGTCRVHTAQNSMKRPKLQQASETIAALDCAVASADAFLGLNQAIGQALMIPFAMVGMCFLTLHGSITLCIS